MTLGKTIGPKTKVVAGDRSKGAVGEGGGGGTGVRPPLAVEFKRRNLGRKMYVVSIKKGFLCSTYLKLLSQRK
jgi:hypothetical protein